MVIGIFTHPIVYYIGFAGMIYMYFRIFSKKWDKRRAENQWYLRKSYAIRNWFDKKKKMWQLKKTHKIFKCPTCKQKIKVPKGKGKIEIRCTKCDTKFIKRS
jgi:DNA-directed RNA polymerase subunit RPC12/RpoP